MSPKGFRRILNVIGRKIFNKVNRTEVEYGQTLTKKRRRNCILKSVSSLSSSNDDAIVHHPTYRIKFEFSKDDSQFRGSVMNFQKIDPEVCCLRNCCDCDSRSEISSDSACDVTSASSCDDLNCKYRKPIKKKSKSMNDIKNIGTVENFIRIHKKISEKGVENPTCDIGTVNESYRDSLIVIEPNYETLTPKQEKPKPKFNEPNYDILLTRADCNVLEPRYENLKLVENVYEMPKCLDASFNNCSENCPFKKIKDLVHSNKTYDEVIESLKLLHSNSNCADKRSISGVSCCTGTERADNEINYYFENYVHLDNNFNNDMEQSLLSY